MPVTNALLVRYQNGYTARTDAASVAAYGRREGFLAVAEMRNLTAVRSVADALLALLDDPRVSAVGALEPAGIDEPYVDFGVGDTVTGVDDDDSAGSQRVRAFTYSEDPEGNPAWGVETNDDIVERGLLLARWLKRMADGTLGGVSASALPIVGAQSATGSEAGSASVSGETAVFHHPDALTVDTSDPYLVRSGGSPTAYAELDTAGTSTTTIRLQKNGVDLTGDLTMGSGVSSTSMAWSDTFTKAVDTLRVEVVTVGTGAAGLVVSVWF